MNHIYSIFNEIHEQLGVTASFDIQIKQEKAEISIKWQDEGGNKFQLIQVVTPKDLKEKPLVELFSPLCDDIRDLLNAVQMERSEVFCQELLEGKIPADLVNFLPG